MSQLGNKGTLEETARLFSIEQQQFKQGLPMYAQKAEFLAHLQSPEQCIVLRGGTGIGELTLPSNEPSLTSCGLGIC